MKKFLYVALAGILIGGIFAIYIFSTINKEVKSVFSSDTQVTAFQVGVYSVYENALKAKEQYPESLIYQDDDIYRVFIAIYQDNEIIHNMKNYYQNNNVNIYLKEINASQEFVLELQNYEKLLKQTTNLDTYISANKNVLKSFGASI